MDTDEVKATNVNAYVVMQSVPRATTQLVLQYLYGSDYSLYFCVNTFICQQQINRPTALS